MRSLVLRQGQLEERMANDRGRGEDQSSPSNEQQDGVRTGGNLPAPGVVRVGGASRDEEFVESVNVGPRELSSIEQAVPKLCGKPENFPVWGKRFEAFVSMSGCLSSPLTGIELAVGDTTKDIQHFVSQGLTHAHIRSARVAWVRLTERMPGTDLFDNGLPVSLREVLGKCFAIGFC